MVLCKMHLVDKWISGKKGTIGRLLVDGPLKNYTYTTILDIFSSIFQMDFFKAPFTLSSNKFTQILSTAF